MVKSLSDLIKEALAEPTVELQGPRIGGITLGDMISRVVYEKQLECVEGEVV